MRRTGLRCAWMRAMAVGAAGAGAAAVVGGGCGGCGGWVVAAVYGLAPFASAKHRGPSPGAFVRWPCDGRWCRNKWSSDARGSTKGRQLVLTQ